jgi:hypothetical protein
VRPLSRIAFRTKNSQGKVVREVVPVSFLRVVAIAVQAAFDAQPRSRTLRSSDNASAPNLARAVVKVSFEGAPGDSGVFYGAHLLPSTARWKGKNERFILRYFRSSKDWWGGIVPLTQREVEQRAASFLSPVFPVQHVSDEALRYAEELIVSMLTNFGFSVKIGEAPRSRAPSASTRPTTTTGRGRAR